MSISSMTGFASKNGEHFFDNTTLTWSFELKSVNGKNIDLKLRTPSWLGDMSIQMRNILSKYFTRGSFNVSLDINSNKNEQKIKINQEILSQITAKAIELYQTNPQELDKPKASDLLNIKGVIEVEENKLSEEEILALQEKLFADFEEVCKNLKISRDSEGAKTKLALVEILTKIQKNAEEIAQIFESIPEKLKEKINLQLKNLLETGNNVSEERLAQEIVFYIAKADIKEEIDRLQLHLKTAHELLNSKEAVGRKLDFLCQELNREANTTCSKSVDITITNLGMELKTLIEQFREQIQNIE
ncbi:MAG: YicC family protein [Alphaproteobacteria bacterium]|nr:YicC family protein [Alphaproteobacteria bacterium]